MALLTKPNMKNIWASGGDIVEPTDLKKQQGWTAEVPPFQYENWIQNRQDEYLAHINQRGIPAWDALTEYEVGGLSYVQGSDGKIYKSVAASGPTTTIQDPTTDATDTYWTVAFADKGAFLTPAEGDAHYAKVASNLSDLTNVATARTNLSVYSKLESDGLYLAKAQNLADLTNTTTARTNLGAAPIVSPTFTGTPTAPTAAPGTNTTQLATTAFVQSQKTTSPTDTTSGRVWRTDDLVKTASTSDQTTGRIIKNGDKQVCTAWVNFNGTGTVAILDSYNVSSITDNGVGDYTINFATAMANTNYILAGSGLDNDSGDLTVGRPAGGLKTTTAIKIKTVNGTAAIDSSDVGVVFFGGN